MFEAEALAMVHLASGDLTEGAARGNAAIDLAGQVRSVRTIDRLEPLQTEAERHFGSRDVRDLSERIVTLRAA